MRKVPYVRAALGAWLLVAPQSIVGTDRPARLVARVLGARHLVQLAVVGRRSGAGWAVAGGAVDAVHALAMLALAAADPGHRRLALLNSATAGALALGSLHEAARA